MSNFSLQHNIMPESLAATGLPETDMAKLHQALLSGQVTLAEGGGSVAIGGPATGVFINTGSIRLEGFANEETLHQALREALDQINRKAEERALRDYFLALRRYCADPPYLSLNTLPGNSHKTFQEVYIQPRFEPRLEGTGLEPEETKTLFERKVCEMLWVAADTAAEEELPLQSPWIE